MEKTNICVKLKKYHILSTVENIKKIVNRSSDIGISSSDVGLLTSTLTTLASAFDSVEGDNKTEVELEMESAQARAAWHCCNMCLSNNLLRNEAHKANAMESMGFLASAIDKFDHDKANKGQQLELQLTDPSTLIV